MRHLQLTRRNEVKTLAQIHKDRDELIRFVFIIIIIRLFCVRFEVFGYSVVHCSSARHRFLLKYINFPLL